MKTGKFFLVEKAMNRNGREGLRSKSFIATEPRFETELLKKGYEQEYKKNLPVLFEISSWEVIGQLVQQGLGVGLLPDIALRRWTKPSFKILKPKWFDAEYEVYAHCSEKSIQNRVQQYALEFLMSKKCI